jgi:hypothetical protein
MKDLKDIQENLSKLTKKDIIAVASAAMETSDAFCSCLELLAVYRANRAFYVVVNRGKDEGEAAYKERVEQVNAAWNTAYEAIKAYRKIGESSEEGKGKGAKHERY